MPDERISYRISRDPDEVASERLRLDHLTHQRDPVTFDVLDRIGVADGWKCLEVGAGSGTVTRWLSERVGEEGSVLAVDVDTRFHVEVGANAEVRRLDVTEADLGDAQFDLVHARALLQHLHQREEVLDKLVAAARPGGWVVVEDGDWTQFFEQELPEPFRTLVLHTSESARERSGWEPFTGRGPAPGAPAPRTERLQRPGSRLDHARRPAERRVVRGRPGSLARRHRRARRSDRRPG